MRMKDRYEPLAENQYYIDKTGAFEKGIAGFPSIYMEGAAASGKTTAVRMLLERHREVTPIIFRMREELKAPETFEEKLKVLAGDFPNTSAWIILEDMPGALPRSAAQEVCALIEKLPPNGRVIILGREEPVGPFLELLWKREMELIPQEVLRFSTE